ncbi:40S ribosomal protein S21-2, partial [Mucuna pruriens]
MVSPRIPPLRHSSSFFIFVKAVHNTQPKMQNEEGQITELYIPRNSATNRLITAKDHASVQINIGHLDENGIFNGQCSTFALCGFIRAQGDADSALDRLWQKKKTEAKQQFDLTKQRTLCLRCSIGHMTCDPDEWLIGRWSFACPKIPCGLSASRQIKLGDCGLQPGLGGGANWLILQ